MVVVHELVWQWLGGHRLWHRHHLLNRLTLLSVELRVDDDAGCFLGSLCLWACVSVAMALRLLALLLIADLHRIAIFTFNLIGICDKFWIAVVKNVAVGVYRDYLGANIIICHSFILFLDEQHVVLSTLILNLWHSHFSIC